MPNLEKVTREIYKKQEDGTDLLIETIQIEVEVPTQEEIIAEKEAELLKMYKELEALKNNQ